jgi:hypothetical protein
MEKKASTNTSRSVNLIFSFLMKRQSTAAAMSMIKKISVTYTFAEPISKQSILLKRQLDVSAAIRKMKRQNNWNGRNMTTNPPSSASVPMMAKK